jgi:hypothetical protein
MQTHELSPMQLRQKGIEALVHSLGAVGMVRFLQQFDQGSGDYTRDRDTILPSITLEDAIAFTSCVTCRLNNDEMAERRSPLETSLNMI